MPAATLPARSDLALEFTWDLESIYAGAAAWEADFKALESRLPELAGFQGTLSSSAEQLAAGLKLRDDLGVTLGKLYSYAHMKRDEDSTVAASQALHDRVVGLYARFSSAAAFFTPEIVALD